MNVVININTVLKSPGYDQSFVLVDCIYKIIDAHPEHSFFIIPASGTTILLSKKNLTFVGSAPKSTNVILWKIWYAYKLPMLLKKYKADIFINMDCICSLKTKVPQCLLVPDLSFSGHVAYFKKNIPVFFEKADSIITFSQHIKNDICQQYPKIAPEKIAVIYNGVDETVLLQDEAGNTKEKYTEGKEYFLYIGDTNSQANLISLLKAFSFFKKRQKSNMHLIIASSALLPGNALVKNLNTYKYRTDVQLLVDTKEEELIKIISNAYVFIYGLQPTGGYFPILKAMQCEVPIIAGNSSVLAEIFGDGILFTDPAIFENIADKMMILFKDENKRTELIGRGKKLAANYPLSTSNKLVWQNIQKSATFTA
jgi:glycosyltransferase involved in cell wall biosynthesis